MNSHALPQISIGLLGTQEEVNRFTKGISFSHQFGQLAKFSLNSFRTKIQKEQEVILNIIKMEFIQGEFENYDFALHNSPYNPVLVKHCEALDNARGEIQHIIRLSSSLTLKENFLKTLSEKCLFIDYHPEFLTSDEILLNIAQGVDDYLVKKMNTKLKTLWHINHSLNQEFENFPKEVTNIIGNFYIQSEFKKEPLSCMFFASKQNREKPQFLPSNPATLRRV